MTVGVHWVGHSGAGRTAEPGRRGGWRRTWALRAAAALLTMALPSAPWPVAAHHSTSAEYDNSQSIELRGVLKDYDWTNPHSWFFFEVTGNDGVTTLWSVQSQAATRLRGWGLQFELDAEYRLRLSPARSGTASGILRVVKFPDGSTFCPILRPDGDNLEECYFD